MSDTLDEIFQYKSMWRLGRGLRIPRTTIAFAQVYGATAVATTRTQSEKPVFYRTLHFHVALAIVAEVVLGQFYLALGEQIKPRTTVSSSSSG
jgi:hypothetical protein